MQHDTLNFSQFFLKQIPLPNLRTYELFTNELCIKNFSEGQKFSNSKNLLANQNQEKIIQTFRQIQSNYVIYTQCLKDIECRLDSARTQKKVIHFQKDIESIRDAIMQLNQRLIEQILKFCPQLEPQISIHITYVINNFNKVKIASACLIDPVDQLQETHNSQQLNPDRFFSF